MGDEQAKYVYDLPTIAGRARVLHQTLASVDRIHYAIKANSHPDILLTLAAQVRAFALWYPPPVAEITPGLKA